MGPNEIGKVVVIYHGKCYDGFTAAWVCKNAIERWLGHEPILIPASYGEPVPEVVSTLGKNDLLYMVDFSYPRNILCSLAEQTRLQVIDHHKTAQANCEGLPFCAFDMERSGAGMAWDFFSAEPRPKLVNYIEDRDLWRFGLPHSAEVHAYLSSYPMNYDQWDRTHKALEEDFMGCVATGSAILRYDNQKVEEMAVEARIVTVAGYPVPAVNCPIQFGSKLAARLLEIYPTCAFAAYYCDAADGSQRWGLRGRVSDDFDVSEIAKQFGGGGHKKASGFVKTGESNRAIQSRN